MKLKVLVPDQVILEEEVSKIIAEGANGSFCLLPHHLDLVTVLVPGILEFTHSTREYLAIDEGILVKHQQEVLVSTLNAVRSNCLESLKQTLAEHFQVLDEQEKLTRSALAKFEANIIRHFAEIGQL
ncbi:MAG: F0F1 ATP synthase subunit epsilon [Gloeocapsa sp. DLM2.Bin57]|nr:MAG: F0F1 ATP synthase subunit epsilon [Gloeocapsa sp. DLM2.Bin57]